MTAPTYSEILQAGINAASTYPNAGTLIRAGDPLLMSQMSSQAAMLELVAAHTEVAQFEPFLKARDATVLADAALKGILPLGRACRVKLSVFNPGPGTFTLAAGRRLQDDSGRYYVADTGLSVPAGQTLTLQCTQKTSRTVTHTVELASPFYKIQIPFEDEAAHLNTLEVWKGGVMFEYAPEWFNVEAGDLAYQVEVDEQRRMWICMGSGGVVGYGVSAGDAFEIRLTECEGRVDNLSAGGSFTLEYTYETIDGMVRATLVEVLDEGADPLTIDELRIISQYQSIHDHSAVYLGNYGALIRRYLKPMTFLSVWNEQVEEEVRGPSVDHINKLFISGEVDGMSNAVFEDRVRRLIWRADDSLRVGFVPKVDTPVPLDVVCTISVVHDEDAVKAQIKTVLLRAYGRGQLAVSVGMSGPLREQAISKVIKAVPALQDEQSDFRITLTLPTALPENYLYLTEASINVIVHRKTTGQGLWGQ